MPGATGGRGGSGARYAFFDVECTGIDPRRLGQLARQVRRAAAPRQLSNRWGSSLTMTSQAQAQAFEEGVLAQQQPEIDDVSRRGSRQAARGPECWQEALRTRHDAARLERVGAGVPHAAGMPAGGHNALESA